MPHKMCLTLFNIRKDPLRRDIASALKRLSNQFVSSQLGFQDIRGERHIVTYILGRNKLRSEDDSHLNRELVSIYSPPVLIGVSSFWQEIEWLYS